jgi:hypothetical protein
LGWDLLVVDRRLPRSPNSFDECPYRHGPALHEYHAWHFGQSNSPAERMLPVFGYPFEVRVSCEGCQLASAEADASGFTAGTMTFSGCTSLPLIIRIMREPYQAVFTT